MTDTPMTDTPVSETPTVTRPTKKPEPPPETDAFYYIDLPLWPDLLRGASEIALFLHGNADKKAVRSVYHLAERTNFCSFIHGSMVCARKSTIRAQIWSQEARGLAGNEDLVRLHILLTSILRLAAANDNGGTAIHTDHTRPLLAEAAHTIQRVLRAYPR